MLSKVLAKPNDFVGLLKRKYEYVSMLKERSATRVWLARSDSRLFVLKQTPSEVFEDCQQLLDKIPEHHNIRRPCDSIPDASIMVYEHRQSNLLTLSYDNQSSHKRKRILKDVLKGLAALHSSGVVHLDIKPDNILIDINRQPDGTTVEHVQVIDFEGAMFLPPGRALMAPVIGNATWRSPEAFCRGQLRTLTDMFSFGAVCVYVMLGKILFGVDEDFRAEIRNRSLPSIIRLQRAISYFGTREDMVNLIQFILDENELHAYVLKLLWDRKKENALPYRHFSTWDVDDDFKDLVLQLMKLDPNERITAQQALEHRWFSGVE